MREEERNERKRGRRFPIVRLLALSVLLVALIYAGCVYVNTYYHANGVAEAALRGDAQVSVLENDDYILFSPVDYAAQEGKEHTGIIFYPGAKVEAGAYAPLALEFARSGYPVYLVRMPARLAVLKENAADAIIEDEPEVTQWILMGHSLGGTVAADYAKDHAGKVELLVLLAAYSTKKLPDEQQVVSIYGSRDGVLNLGRYEKYRDNLPESVEEYVIEGANHAGFGNYGAQKGDMAAEISTEEQQQSVVDAVCYYLKEK